MSENPVPALSKPSVQTMTKSDKLAYGGSLLVFAFVLGMAFVVGIVADNVDHSQNDLEKAEGFFQDLRAITMEIPRLPNGSIVRQGELSTAWLDNVGALPTRLQAMAGSLRGHEGQRWLGLVRRGPWSTPFVLEARDSLIWTSLLNVPKAVCEPLARAIAKHPDQVAYVSTSGDPVVVPAAMDISWLCRERFNNFALVTLDSPTEVRRLAADIQNAIKAMPANLTDKVHILGSSAPFQVAKSQENGPGYLQNGSSGTRVAISNVPFGVCRLALLGGPAAFGMDLFETPDGKTTRLPQTRAASDALCNVLKGRLIMSRR